MRGCGIITGAVPGAVITAASAAVTSRIPLMKATAIPKAITAPNMIASIHGDVISTLGPVRYCECEVLHTASNIFIGHKMPTPDALVDIVRSILALVRSVFIR
jgi:hypothetical protein